MPYIGRDLNRGNYLKLDDISSSFDSSTTTFNLTVGGSAFIPGSAFSILVSVGGVIQEPESAYQVNNSEITFANAPTAQDSFFCIALGVSLGIGVPANGTVNGPQLAKPFNYDGFFYLDDANNRVGINSSVPKVALDVNGNAKISGILTAGSYSGPISNPSGISTFYDVRVTNNLTVEGSTTTLDTDLTAVDRVEVDANSNSIVGVAITQSGTADIVNLFDGASQVVTIDDVGNVGLGSAIPESKFTLADGTNPILTLRRNGTLITGNHISYTDYKGNNTLFGRIGYWVDSPGGGLAQFRVYSGNNVRMTVGSAGDCPVYLLNDSDTYWSHPANNNHAFTTAGVERFRIDHNGNVGIGTDNPGTNHKLEILGNASAYATLNVKSQSLSHGSALELGAVDDDDYGSIYQFASGSGEGGRMRFTAGGIETMNLRGGKVGIGEANPATLLEVSAGTNKNLNVWSSGAYATGITIGSANDAFSAYTPIEFRGSEFYFHNGTAEKVRITSDGDVLVNTVTAPTADIKLLVSGNGGVSSGSYFSFRGEYGNTAEPAAYAIKFDSSATHLSASGGLHQYAYGGIAFNLGGQDRVNFTTTGSVGIGTTNPLSLLHVDGDVTIKDASPAIFFSDDSGVPQNPDYKIQVNTGNFVINDDTNSETRLLINSSGNIGIGSDNPARPLSIRTGDGTIALHGGNAGIYIGTHSTGGFQNNCAIARAGANNYHITNSSVGDLCIAGESTKDIIIGTSAHAGAMAERLRITSAGKVGVNQSTWSSKDHMFEVKQSTNDKEIARFTVDAGSGSVQGKGFIGLSAFNSTTHPHASIGVEEYGTSHYEGHLTFATRNASNDSAPTERLRITSTGTVGIGSEDPGTQLDIFKYTNTNASSTGTTLLRLTNHVGSTDGDGDILSPNGQQTFVDFRFMDANSNFTPQVRIGAQVGQISGDSGQASEGFGSFVVHTATATNSGGSLSEKFRVTPTGKVGVNESSPDHMFHIKGTSTDNNPILAVESDSWVSGRSAALRLAYTAGNAREIRGHYENGLQFILNNGQAMRIATDGDVIVGDGSPEATLHVHNSTGGYATDKAGMKSNAVMKLRPHASDSTNMLFASVNSGGGIGVQVTNGPATADWDLSLSPFGGYVGVHEVNPGRLLTITNSSTGSYNATSFNGENNTLLRIHNPSGTDNSGVGYHTGLEFVCSSGANSYGQIGLVRTGNNIGDIFFKFRTAASSYAERLRLTSTGFLGINESDPNCELFVRSTSDNNPSIKLYRNSGGGDTASINWAASTGTNAQINYRGGSGSEGLQFRTATSYGNTGSIKERFRINTGAYQGVQVFVMTDSDNSPIDDVTAITIQNGTGGGDTGNTSEPTHIDWKWVDNNSNVTPQCRISGHVGDGGDPNSHAKEGKGFLTFHCSNTGNTSGVEDPPERLRIAHDGTFTGSSSNNISDQRLKENIATITNPIAKIKALKGRTFTWKSEASMREGTHYGFIAQEVESIIPDLIVDNTGIRVFDKDDNLQPSNVATPPVGGGYAKSVDSDGVTPVLVEALKEALSKIEVLEAKVAALEGS